MLRPFVIPAKCDLHVEIAVYQHCNRLPDTHIELAEPAADLHPAGHQSRHRRVHPHDVDVVAPSTQGSDGLDLGQISGKRDEKHELKTKGGQKSNVSHSYLLRFLDPDPHESVGRLLSLWEFIRVIDGHSLRDASWG